MDAPIPVGTVEIAELLGVSRSAVDAWRTRDLGFPEPKWTVGGRPAWAWAEVEAWVLATGRARTLRYAADDGSEHWFTVIGPAGAEVIHLPKYLACTEKVLKDWMDLSWQWSPRADGGEAVMIVPFAAWLDNVGARGLGSGLLLDSPAVGITGAIADRLSRVSRSR
jgi:predicted DNA-binding transcriptional regulator AlpA